MKKLIMMGAFGLFSVATFASKTVSSHKNFTKRPGELKCTTTTTSHIDFEGNLVIVYYIDCVYVNY